MLRFYNEPNPAGYPCSQLHAPVYWMLAIIERWVGIGVLTAVDWLLQNKEWPFSGVGALLVPLVVQWVQALRDPSRRRKALETRLVRLRDRADQANLAVARAEAESALMVSPPQVQDSKPPAVEGREANAEPQPCCSFCGRPKNEVEHLVAGPTVYICNDCGQLVDDIIFENVAGDRREAIQKICDLSMEASAPGLGAQTRRELRDRIHALAMKVRMHRRPKPGDVVGTATLERIVGMGAFGSVWVATRPVTTRSHHREAVAVKIFDEDKLPIGLMLWRFLRGIRAMKHLSERNDVPPSVITLFDVAESGLAFSMPYLPGGDLERAADYGWTMEKKLTIFAGVLQAVKFAHRNGIVHRDIKPANIVLDACQNSVLTDFDIADLQFSKTQSIVAGGLGTPQFAAPEQLIGSSLLAHPTADVYSLGKLLYFLLTEKAPPVGSTEEGYMPEYLSVLEPRLAEVVHRCLRTDPEQRYQSIDLLLEAYPFPAPPSSQSDASAKSHDSSSAQVL